MRVPNGHTLVTVLLVSTSDSVFSMLKIWEERQRILRSTLVVPMDAILYDVLGAQVTALIPLIASHVLVRYVSNEYPEYTLYIQPHLFLPEEHSPQVSRRRTTGVGLIRYAGPNAALL